MEYLEESEDLSTQNDDLLTMTVVMNKYCLMMMTMIEAEDLDAADILMRLSGSDTHSARSTSNSPPGAGSKTSSYSISSINNKRDAEDDKSFCPTNTVACGGHERPSLLPSSSSSFRPAVLRKRDLVADDDDGEDKDVLLIDIGCGEIESYPLRRKRKFRSILDVYAQTKPFLQPVATNKSKIRPPRGSTTN